MGNKGKCKFVIAMVFAMLFVFVITGCVENNLNENDTVIVVNKEYEEAHTFLAPVIINKTIWNRPVFYPERYIVICKKYENSGSSEQNNEIEFEVSENIYNKIKINDILRYKNGGLAPNLEKNKDPVEQKE